MSRWKVRRKNAMFIHPHEGDLCYGPRWTITSPTGVDWGNKATWAGAMAKADRQARTTAGPATEPASKPETNTEADMLTFTIQGRPAAQGSKRHIGHGRMVEQSKYLKPWRDKLIREMRHQYQGQPLDTPIEVSAAFFMPRPKRPKFPVPAVTPDADKLARAVGDALQLAGVVKDDSRIVTWHITKTYHPDGWTGVTLTITQHH